MTLASMRRDFNGRHKSIHEHFVSGRELQTMTSEVMARRFSSNDGLESSTSELVLGSWTSEAHPVAGPTARSRQVCRTGRDCSNNSVAFILTPISSVA
jgi:hypothetical protein